MTEQLLSHRTLYGWLVILAATILEDVGDGSGKLMATVSLPVAVIDLPRRSVHIMSPRMRDLLGLGVPGSSGSSNEADLEVTDLQHLVREPTMLGALMTMLMEASIDAYQVRRCIRRSDGRTFDVDSWVSVCERDDRQKALWVISPVDDDAGRYLPAPTAAAWPDRVPGVAIGSLDAEWRVERVSPDVTTLVGYRPGEVLGAPLVEFVHPDDVAALLNAAAHAVIDRAGVSAEVRVRHRSGEWTAAHIMLTLLAEDRLQFGFVLAVSRPGDETANRVAELERRLWRIAQEVEAAGVAAGFTRVPDSRTLPGIDTLSPRQWEVLTRVLRGERVATIAEGMYLSPSTVRNHLADVYRKLGVHSQVELMQRMGAAERVEARAR